MSQQSERARVLIEVVGGIIPGTPIPELTRQWALTEKEWGEDGEKGFETLAERNGQAMGYAMLLMMAPQQVNWVRTNWIWL
jgi:hypothetical protein